MKIDNHAEFIKNFGESLLAQALGVGKRAVSRWKYNNRIPVPYVRLLECLTEEQLERLRAKARKYIRARATTYLTPEHKCAECGHKPVNNHRFCANCGREILYG